MCENNIKKKGDGDVVKHAEDLIKVPTWHWCTPNYCISRCSNFPCPSYTKKSQNNLVRFSVNLRYIKLDRNVRTTEAWNIGEDSPAMLLMKHVLYSSDLHLMTVCVRLT